MEKPTDPEQLRIWDSAFLEGRSFEAKAISRDGLEYRREHKYTRVWCMRCGKSVSNEVPEETTVRAWVECPECIGLEKNNPIPEKVEILKVFYSLFTVLMDEEPEPTLIRKLRILNQRLKEATETHGEAARN